MLDILIKLAFVFIVYYKFIVSYELQYYVIL